MFYGRATAGSSAFSLYTAPDESPAINDVATLRSGKVTRELPEVVGPSRHSAGGEGVAHGHELGVGLSQL